MTTTLNAKDCISALADTPFPLHTNDAKTVLYTNIRAGASCSRILFELRSEMVGGVPSTFLDLTLPFLDQEDRTLLPFPHHTQQQLFWLQALCRQKCQLADAELNVEALDGSDQSSIYLVRTELIKTCDLQDGSSSRLVCILTALQDDWERLDPILQTIATNAGTLDTRIFQLAHCNATMH